MTSATFRRAGVSAIVAAILGGSPDARAVDAFEIQVYDATVDEPGSVGVEVHANSVISGVRTSVPPELPAHRQSHFTLEPAIGITHWWEAGMYLQTTLLPDGSFDYAGSKLRTKFVVPSRGGSRFGWGVNMELSRIAEQYDRNRWGAEIRPIATWSSPGGRVYTSVNPIVDFSLAGPGRSEAPDFEPAATICYVFPGLMSVGVEYYASFGPLGSWQPLAEQEHYLFQVINVLRWKRLELNLGAGDGLTQGSNGFVAKTILGVQVATGRWRCSSGRRTSSTGTSSRRCSPRRRRLPPGRGHCCPPVPHTCSGTRPRRTTG
jgi:hypothetical protein